MQRTHTMLLNMKSKYLCCFYRTIGNKYCLEFREVSSYLQKCFVLSCRQNTVNKSTVSLLASVFSIIAFIFLFYSNKMHIVLLFPFLIPYIYFKTCVEIGFLLSFKYVVRCFTLFKQFTLSALELLDSFLVRSHLNRLHL